MGPFLSDSKALGYTWKCREIPKISGKAWEIPVNPGNPGAGTASIYIKWKQKKSVLPYLLPQF